MQCFKTFFKSGLRASCDLKIKLMFCTHFCRTRDGGGAGHREGRNLPQQTIYHWKGNLSKSPIHFGCRQNILISRLYEQFSRNDYATASEKKFRLVKHEHIIFSKSVLNIKTRLVVTVELGTKWMPNSDSTLNFMPEYKFLGY